MPCSGFKLDENGAAAGGITKFVAGAHRCLQGAARSLQNGAFVALRCRGQALSLVQKRAGILRTMLGTGARPPRKERLPLLLDRRLPHVRDRREESGELEFCHNPFSMPQGGMKALEEQDPLEVLAYQYDIVCNGRRAFPRAPWRNHDPEIMLKAFSLVGMGKEGRRQEVPPRSITPSSTARLPTRAWRPASTAWSCSSRIPSTSAKSSPSP